ncbi:MAG: hypothetical protein JXM70_02900 [Pirellulales bacterium]|nr:hypothetical protein [Pirellulales bacterium]
MKKNDLFRQNTRCVLIVAALVLGVCVAFLPHADAQNTDDKSAAKKAAKIITEESTAKAKSSETGSPSPQLAALEWMIGDWVDKGDDMTLSLNCRWNKNKHFIIRSFKIMVDGQVGLEGQQVMVWDPIRKTIRSWMFDSEGGFGEAVWKQNGNRWIANTSQVLREGKRASSINILTPLDKDSFTWQSVGREVDGELLPSTPKVTVVRKSSEKK